MLEKIRSVTVAHLKEISAFPNVVARLCIKDASQTKSVCGDHVNCIAMSSTSNPSAQLSLKANQLTGAHLMVQPCCLACCLCAPTLVVWALVASPSPYSHHPGTVSIFSYIFHAMRGNQMGTQLQFTYYWISNYY